MNFRNFNAIAAAVITLGAAAPASATIIGSLANFDVVNDTGRNAYGFEIEFEDSSFSSSKITSVFGYDRDFGLPGGPGAVVRYGKPIIEDIAGFGVRITFGGTVGNVFTPFNDGSFNTPGESCWPLGAGWSTGSPCDHYGVSTLGQPAVTRYKWLVEDTPGSGNLVPIQAAIPAVQFQYTPPVQAAGEVAAQPARLNAVIAAVAPNREAPDNDGVWGEAFWVRSFKTKVKHDVDLADLFRGDDDQEAAAPEIKTRIRWELFQKAPAGMDDGNIDEVEIEGIEDVLEDDDRAVLRRYEFYKVNLDGLGIEVDADGRVDCKQDCNDILKGGDQDLEQFEQTYVGAFVGAQMVGFNVDEQQAPIQLAAPVPEPSTYAMLGAGLGLMGLFARRRR